MTWRLVAAVTDVPAGESRFFEIDGQAIVIANCGGTVFALDGICPHLEYRLDGACVSEVAIVCPWHGYEYDLRTGANLYPGRPDIALRAYEVQIRNSEIWIALK